MSRVLIGGLVGGGSRISITRLSEDPADYVFVDGVSNVVNMNVVQIDVIDFGNHVGAMIVYLEADIHNWVATGPPYRLNSTTFPANPIVDTIRAIGTVFGSGNFTETGANTRGSLLLSPPGVFFEVTNGVQPNNNVSQWAGEIFFLYG